MTVTFAENSSMIIDNVTAQVVAQTGVRAAQQTLLTPHTVYTVQENRATGS